MVSIVRQLWVPFSEYPTTRQFTHPKIPRVFLILSIASLLALVVFNTLTQGWESQNETVLKSHWYPKNETLHCQPAILSIGNSLFTNGVSKRSIYQRLRNEQDPRGAFPWTICGVLHGSEGHDVGQTGFQYQDTPLKCNITYISLSFHFRLRTYSYSMAVMCSTQSVKVESEDNYITLSTEFSKASNNVPTFGVKIQDTIRDQISGILKYYSSLNLSENALSGSAFPPYSLPNNILANQRVEHKDIIEWETWMSMFNYTPTEHYQDFDHSQLYLQPRPQGRIQTHLVSHEAQSMDFSEATLKLWNSPSSSLQINTRRIVGIRLIPLDASFAKIAKLPAPLPLYINLTQSILATMMDLAGKDVNGRVLGTSYLCTSTSRNMKRPLQLLALLFGNVSGAFGVAWTLMIF
ncbi:hypothetical protein O181_004933, partial [Austropuccinia psidii MF-1]|nr:hypothetical protein [Austropuccinia psidii MF-1]